MLKKKFLLLLIPFVLFLWNVLNVFDALTTFWSLRFELVYDANWVVNWLNVFGRGYVFVYFMVVALLVNFLVIHFSRDKEVEPYVVGALLFYCFIILLAVIQNGVLIYEWVY